MTEKTETLPIAPAARAAEVTQTLRTIAIVVVVTAISGIIAIFAGGYWLSNFTQAYCVILTLMKKVLRGPLWPSSASCPCVSGRWSASAAGSACASAFSSILAVLRHHSGRRRRRVGGRHDLGLARAAHARPLSRAGDADAGGRVPDR